MDEVTDTDGESVITESSVPCSNEYSYLYGRDPSILAYGQRPAIDAASKKNLESLLYENTTDESTEVTADTIKVYLRMKPHTHMKLTTEQSEAYKIINSTTLLTRLPSSIDNNASHLKKQKGSDIVSRKYVFTQTFGPQTTQLTLFEEAVKPHMIEFLAGKSSVVMTYGTTNSGKSYTLQGSASAPGIIPRGLEFVFTNINPSSTICYKPVMHSDIIVLDAHKSSQELDAKMSLLSFNSTEKCKYINTYKQMQKMLQAESTYKITPESSARYSVWVSFAEIYNETIYDLLSNECQKRRPPLKLATDSKGRLFIKDLKMINVISGSEAYQVLMAGQYNLKIAATALNSRSSRSHCIFTIKLLKYYSQSNPDKVEVSTFTFCDLAGSERLNKTLNVGDRLKEAQNINTSLLVLSRCLKSMYEHQTSRLTKQKNEPVGPFRESKLTRLFQRALSGKEHIVLIVNINPGPSLYVETQNVLKFSAIAKKIVIEPKEKNVRRTSRSRFSQVVTQSIKTVTDWDTVNIECIDENDEEEDKSSESMYIDEEEYEALIEENKHLKKEIANMKEAALTRDLQIREEMTKYYTEILKKRESDYMKRIKEVEEQQEEYLDWKQNAIETYYMEQLNQFSARKRQRSDFDEDDEEEKQQIEELEKENDELHVKVESLKKKIITLKKEKEDLFNDKNKLTFDIGYLQSELKKTQKLLDSVQVEDNSSLLKELQTQLDNEKELSNKLKDLLNDAKEEYIEMTKEEKIIQKKNQELKIRLEENSDRITDLEEQLDCANICLAEKTKTIEGLEEKLDGQTKCLLEYEKKISSMEVKRVEMSSQTDAVDVIENEIQTSFVIDNTEKFEEMKEKCTADINNLMEELDVTKRKLDELEETKLKNAKKETEYEIEISKLQQEIKMLVSSSRTEETLNKKMESEMKTTLRELTQTTDALEKAETALKELQQSSDQKIEALEKQVEILQQNGKILDMVRTSIEDRAKELEQIKIMNEELKNNLVQKDHEMDTFIKRREEQFSKYEEMVKDLQTDINVKEKEINRLQDLLRKQSMLSTAVKEENKDYQSELQQTQIKLKNLQLPEANKDLFETSEDESVAEKRPHNRRKGRRRENQETTSEDETIADKQPTNRRRGKKEKVFEDESTPEKRSNSRRRFKQDEITSEEEVTSANKRQTRQTRNYLVPLSSPNTINDTVTIEVSSTESKRTNKCTPLGPPPIVEVKRTNRRKKLFKDDDDVIDIQAGSCENIPPSPALSTRSLRNRRKQH